MCTCLTTCCGHLSAGRRASDRRGPSGDLGPLDPAIKVLEIESLGIKVQRGCSSTLLQERLSTALPKVLLGHCGWCFQVNIHMCSFAFPGSLASIPISGQDDFRPPLGYHRVQPKRQGPLLSCQAP